VEKLFTKKLNAATSTEQLRRFKDRQKTAFKKFKITAEDWRNREKWDDYKAAVCEMVDWASTDLAPWHLIESENKYFGRIKILKTSSRRSNRN
jgi:polyphosphate kinase 2 (PPK2 family)